MSERIVLIREQAPVDSTNGSDLRLWNMLRGDADVICCTGKDRSEAGAPLDNPLRWRSLSFLQGAHLLPPFRRGWNPPSRFKQSAPKLFEDLAQRCRDAEALPGTVFVLSSHRFAYALAGEIGPRAVFDPVDSLALYFSRYAKSLWPRNFARSLNAYSWALTYRLIERYIAGHCRATIVAGNSDRALLQHACPNANVHWIPNGTTWLERDPVADPGDTSESSIFGFYGSMTWHPNVRSAEFLANTVLPLVRKTLPRAELWIAGGPLSQRVTALQGEGVRLFGHVPDVHHWLSGCHVFAMPMFSGGGFKNKLAEAMAAGMPIVTNKLGAESLSPECMTAIVMRETPHEIAATILDLLQHGKKRSELRIAARLAAKREFAWSIKQEQYARVLSGALEAR